MAIEQNIYHSNNSSKSIILSRPIIPTAKIIKNPESSKFHFLFFPFTPTAAAQI